MSALPHVFLFTNMIPNLILPHQKFTHPLAHPLAPKLNPIIIYRHPQ